MNKYILFLHSFKSEDGLYEWIANTKYGLAYQDDNFYYIKRNGLKPYPISKDLEFTVYTTGDIVKGV